MSTRVDRYTRVPLAMRAERRWLCYQLEPDPNHPEKPRKVPKQARRRGVNASSNDPRTWATFDEARAAVERFLEYAGIGFALGDGWVGVDCDHCIEDGRLATWAAQILRELQSYTEISPSGTGVHVVVRGMLPTGRRKRGAIEMYDADRYFTVTGRHVRCTPADVAERSRELALIHARYFPPPAPKVETPMGVSTRTPPSDDDFTLLERARQARNGARFAALYAGDTTGYASASEADLALCSHLVYWTAGDTARVDRLFRSSGLFREKWDVRRGELTYGQRTIAQATNGARTVVRPLAMWEMNLERAMGGTR